MRAPHVLALDSGIGGLGIVAALRRAVPGVSVTYLADHAFYPYGERDGAILARRIVALVAALAALRPPDLVVVACNTASTIALDPLRASIAVPIVGVVPPLKWAAARSRSRVIGLLATEATVGRDYVATLRRRFAPDCRLVVHGARGLADIAEARFRGLPVPADNVRAELARLFGQPDGTAIDTVCLGCTHYGLLIDELRAASPREVEWLDPAEPVARHAATLLAALPHPPRDRADPVDLALSTRLPDDASTLAAGFARHGFARLEAFPAAAPETVAPAADQWPRLTA